MADESRLIVWGCGALGGRVARLWRSQQGPVIGLTQSERRHPALEAAGIIPATGNPLELLYPTDALLLSLPGHATQQEAVELMVEAGQSAPRRVVLLSTVGYYGPTAHGLIAEKTPPGHDDRSQSIAEAEQVFRQWAGASGVVIRLGGLYSANRGPMSALARRKTMKRRPPDKTLALIHYDDAARAIFEALRHPSPEVAYVTVTSPCPTREQFYTAACRALDLPAPEFAEPINLPPAQYDVSRLRRDLLPQPAYPRWQSALELGESRS